MDEDFEDDQVPEEEVPLQDVLNDCRPEDVPELEQFEAADSYYRLLRGLTGSPTDFRIRLAAVQMFIAEELRLRGSGASGISRDDLDRLLNWLKPEYRNRTISRLQHWGWWHYRDSWRTSELGLSLYRCLLPALQSTSDSALVEAYTMAEAGAKLGHDPILTLQAFQRQMDSLLQDIDRANELHSNVFMRQLKAKIPDSLRLGEMMLSFKADLTTDPQVAAEVRKSHRTLSRLTKSASQMEENLTAIESQQLQLPENSTLDDVTRAFMNRGKEELAAAMREAFHTPYVPTVFLNEATLATMAEYYLKKDRDAPIVADWDKPAEAPTGVTIPEEWLSDAKEFAADMAALPHEVAEFEFEDVVVKNSPQTSMLRMALLSFIGTKDETGVAGAIAKLPFTVETEEGARTLYGKPVKRISNGKLRRKI